MKIWIGNKLTTTTSSMLWSSCCKLSIKCKEISSLQTPGTHFYLEYCRSQFITKTRINIVKPVNSDHWREFWKRSHKTGSFYIEVMIFVNKIVSIGIHTVICQLWVRFLTNIMICIKIHSLKELWTHLNVQTGLLQTCKGPDGSMS